LSTYCCYSEEIAEKFTGLESPKSHGHHNTLSDDSETQAEAETETEAEAEADIIAWIQHQIQKS
jgi:hypothetical protein